MLGIRRGGEIVIWIILAIAVAGIIAISLSVVHALVGIGLILAAEALQRRFRPPY